MTNKRYLIIGMLAVVLVLVTTVGWAAEKEEQIELTAKKMVINNLESKVVATGEVVFKRLGLTLRCHKLTGQQELKKVKATGKVVVKQEARKLKSEQLKLNYKSQTAVLTGHPRLIRNQLTVSGDKFEVDLAADQLTVIGKAHLEAPTQNLVADAEQLYYRQQKEEVILVGQVRVVQGERRIEGPRVVVDLAREKIQIKGNSKLVLPVEQGDEDAN